LLGNFLGQVLGACAGKNLGCMLHRYDKIWAKILYASKCCARKNKGWHDATDNKRPPPSNQTEPASIIILFRRLKDQGVTDASCCFAVLVITTFSAAFA
jgi:hypothetical protein